MLWPIENMSHFNQSQCIACSHLIDTFNFHKLKSGLATENYGILLANISALKKQLKAMGNVRHA